MSRNDISFAYRIESLPGPMRPAEVLRTIRDALDNGGELPEGFDVTWRWRNTPAQDMREASLAETVTASTPSFVGLMRRRLTRDLVRAEFAEREREIPPPDEPGPGPGDIADREAAQRHARRSAAARKGWETRRKNQRAREREKRAAQRKRASAKGKGSTANRRADHVRRNRKSARSAAPKRRVLHRGVRVGRGAGDRARAARKRRKTKRRK